MAAISVSVQQADFDVARLQAALLSGLYEEGAVTSFTGYVRRANDQRQVTTLELEHYPGMTEASIRQIIEQPPAPPSARRGWPKVP